MRTLAALLLLSLLMTDCAPATYPDASVGRATAAYGCGPAGGQQFYVQISEHPIACGDHSAEIVLSLGGAGVLPSPQRIDQVSGTRSSDGGNVNVTNGVVEILAVTDSDFVMTWSLAFADGTTSQGESRVARCGGATPQCI